MAESKNSKTKVRFFVFYQDDCKRLRQKEKSLPEDRLWLIPNDCSPHKLRHSCAMVLLEEGVDLIVIRDLLGHSSVQTTEIYARVSSIRRRVAIEAAGKEIVPKYEG